MVADSITFDGGYRPMNRIGIGQHCTFETATKFIVDCYDRATKWQQPGHPSVNPETRLALIEQRAHAR
jgi:hypothetical protein